MIDINKRNMKNLNSKSSKHLNFAHECRFHFVHLFNSDTHKHTDVRAYISCMSFAGRI